MCCLCCCRCRRCEDDQATATTARIVHAWRSACGCLGPLAQGTVLGETNSALLFPTATITICTTLSRSAAVAGGFSLALGFFHPNPLCIVPQLCFPGLPDPPRQPPTGSRGLFGEINAAPPRSSVGGGPSRGWGASLAPRSPPTTVRKGNKNRGYRGTRGGVRRYLQSPSLSAAASGGAGCGGPKG